MHPLAFGEKIKFPSLKDITYLQPCQRQGAGKASGMNNQSPGSSSRSDTSQWSNPLLLTESMESTTNAAMPWASQETGHIHAMSSEAHSL